MNNLSKQRGSALYEFLGVIIVLMVIFIWQYFSRSELYDEDNNFQSSYIENNHVKARIEYLKWYDGEYVNYYVFTNIGKLHIDAKNHGWWYSDELMYDELEEYVGQTCTFKIESSWWHDWQATEFHSCSFDEL